MINTNLYLKDNYLNKNIHLISNSKIVEYDLREAGLNILYCCDIFSKKQYEKIKKMEKKDRNVFIGKLLKSNPEWSEILLDGFKEVRKEFFDRNNIKESDILSIKKDAIFIIDKYIEHTKLNDFLEFRPKNYFISYLNVNNKEHFLNDEKKLIVKGYSKEILEFQNDYFFNFIEEIMKMIYLNNKDDLFIKLAYFKNDFINFNLRKEYYKDIRINKYIFSLAENIISLDEIEEELKKYCFINNNLAFINEIIMKVL